MTKNMCISHTGRERRMSAAFREYLMGTALFRTDDLIKMGAVGCRNAQGKDRRKRRNVGGPGLQHVRKGSQRSAATSAMRACRSGGTSV